MKTRKTHSLTFLLIFVAAMLMFGACGDSAATTETTVTAVVEAEPTAVPTEAPAEPTEIAEPAEADAMDVPDDVTLTDPYGMYVVTEEWLQENGGYVVERNGKLYSFCGSVMGDVPEKYGIGYSGSIVRTYLSTELFLYDKSRVDDVPTNLNGTLAITFGDFPIFELSKDEEVRLYTFTDVPDDAYFMAADFYGYSILASHLYGGEPYTLLSLQDHFLPSQYDIVAKKPSVCNVRDVPVDDVYNLEYGQEYKYEWFEGTEYHEQQTVASSKVFSVDDFHDFITAPVELTKFGYAVVDMSSMETGLYAKQNGGIFELVD